MKRIWNNGMALLLVLAMLLPMLGMAQPVMAAEGGTEAVTETDTGTAEAVEQYGPRMEAAEAADGSQDAETPIATAFTTYAEPQDDNQAAAAQDAQAGVQETNAAVVVPGRKGMVFSVRKAKRAASVVEDGYDVSSKWSWSVQWVGEADPYDAGTKADDFALKYQINFHSDLDTLKPGQVVIRLPAWLYENTDENGRKQGRRDGKSVLPEQVAVPKGTYVEGEAGTFVESAQSPFNYDYVDNSHGSKDIVFWNYMEIAPGTTTSFQVAYGLQDFVTSYGSSAFIDGTKIKLTPSISIPNWTLTEVTQDEDGNNQEETVHGGSISATGTPLTGQIDMRVQIDRCVISELSDDNNNNTENTWNKTHLIYTEEQLQKTLGSSFKISEQYKGENFDDYYFVSWYVYACSQGNQPHVNTISVTSTATSDDGGVTVQGEVISGGSVSKTYGSSIYDYSLYTKVYPVVAYPKEGLGMLPRFTLSATATCHPTDGLDADSFKTASYTLAYVAPTVQIHNVDIGYTGNNTLGNVSTTKTHILYTEKQLKAVLGSNFELPEKYSGDNFDDYYYVGWYTWADIYGRQAGDLTLASESYATSSDGKTTVTGEIIDGSPETWTKIGPYKEYSPSADDEYIWCLYSEPRSAFVVIAYPKAGLGADCTFTLRTTGTCHPHYGIGEDTSKTVTATLKYVDPGYVSWGYAGDIFRPNKYKTRYYNGGFQYDSSPTLEGYLSRLEQSLSRGKDSPLGDFDVSNYTRKYKTTHDTTNLAATLGQCQYNRGYVESVVSDDAVYAYSANNTDTKVLLDSDDYYFSYVGVKSRTYGYEITVDPETLDQSGKAAPPTETSPYSRDLTIQAMFGADGENPDTWVDVAVVPFDTSGTLNSDNRYIEYEFTAADLAREPYRVRAIQKCTDYELDLRIAVSVTAKWDSPEFARMVGEGGNVIVQNISSQYNLIQAPDGTKTTEGTAVNNTVYTDHTVAKGYSADLEELTSQIHGGTNAVDTGWDYVKPYRCVATATLTRLSSVSETYQGVSTANNVEKGSVDLDYTVCGYEGYSGDGAYTAYCSEQSGVELIPKRREVKIYDLLPMGVHYDMTSTPTAGTLRIYHGSTSLTTLYGQDVSVELTDYVTNYNRTGRNMAEFTLMYSGDDASYYGKYYTSSQDKYTMGFGVKFKAYIKWDDLESSTIGPNQAAYIPSDGGALLGDAYKDDGSADTYGKLFGSDINGDGETDIPSVMFSSINATASYATAYEAGIDKKVLADADAGGVPVASTEVGAGGGYTYYLSIKTRDATKMSDITVFDQIENVDVNHWQGIFQGVSYDEATSRGANVVVWYNADREAPLPDNKIASTMVAENVLTAENGWFTEADWNTQGKPLSDVKAIAMQLNGLELGEEQILTLKVHMKAPEQAKFDDQTYAYGTTWNRSHMLATVQSTINSPGQVRMHDSRDVSVAVLPERPYLYLTKTLKGVPDGVDASNDIFTFQVKLYDKKAKAFIPAADREYWIVDDVHLDGDVPEKLETGRTDADGSVTFKAGQVVAFQADYPHQRFEVTEPEPGIGWKCAENEIRSFVDDYGTEASITNTWNRLTVMKNMAEKGTTNDAAQAFDMVDGKYGFKLVDGEYVSNNQGKGGTTAMSTWTAKYDMDSVSFKYSYSCEDKYDKFTLTFAGETIENGVSGVPTEVKTWSGSLKKGDTIVMKYTKDGSADKNDDQCKVYDISASTWVPVDTEDDTEFTFELKNADDSPVANAPLVIGAVSGSTDADGRFHLKAGQTASIAVATGDYTVTEVSTAGYEQVLPVNGEAAHVTVSTEGSNAVEFLNVAEDGGYVFPKTGGTGVVPICGIGAMLALCGCAALVGIRKRKETEQDG